MFYGAYCFIWRKTNGKSQPTREDNALKTNIEIEISVGHRNGNVAYIVKVTL